MTSGMLRAYALHPRAQQASSRFEKVSARFGAVQSTDPHARNGLSSALPFFFVI